MVPDLLLPLTFWSLAFYVALPGLRSFARSFAGGLARLFPFSPFGRSGGADPRALLAVIWGLQEIQETLEAGVYPDESLWKAMEKFPDPWDRLGRDGLQALRAQGASILPSLRRIRGLAESVRRLERETSSKIAPALGQAWVCIGGVPLLGFGLYRILDGLEAYTEVWILICAAGSGLAVLAASWIQRLSDRARWGGLPPDRRQGFLGVLVSGERFCAKVRSGSPADLAFADAAAFLGTLDPELSRVWRKSVWDLDEGEGGHPGVKAKTEERREILPLLEDFGRVLKKAVQVSLMDGRPCLERAELSLDSLRSDLFSVIDAEVARLPHRTLLPLFLGIAPAVVGLIFGAIALTSFEAWTSL